MRRSTHIIVSISLCGMLLFACRKNHGGNNQQAVNDVVETMPPVLYPVNKRVNNVIGGYYAGLPARYAMTTKTYPLLVFLPGGGQMGDGQVDLPLVLNDGVMRLVDKKKFPPSFTVKGKTFSFINLSPQFSRYPSNAEIESFIRFALQNYRVDTSRIYLSGLSMGGVVTADMGGEFPAQLAAIVPIAGVSVDPGLEAKVQQIATGNLPVWIFHNSNDPVNSVSSTYDFVDRILSYHPAIKPVLTMFQADGHDAWTQAIDPAYKENNLNMYEWMLQYSR